MRDRRTAETTRLRYVMLDEGRRTKRRVSSDSEFVTQSSNLCSLRATSSHSQLRARLTHCSLRYTKSEEEETQEFILFFSPSFRYATLSTSPMSSHTRNLPGRARKRRMRLKAGDLTATADKSRFLQNIVSYGCGNRKSSQHVFE